MPKHDWFRYFIRKIVIPSFWSHKLHKIGSRNIYFFYLRKLSRFLSQFCSTALVQSFIWHKKCLLLMQYNKADLKIVITFSSVNKKNIHIFMYILFYAILCDQKIGISRLSISIMSIICSHNVIIHRKLW